MGNGKEQQFILPHYPSNDFARDSHPRQRVVSVPRLQIAPSQDQTWIRQFLRRIAQPSELWSDWLKMRIFISEIYNLAAKKKILIS